jgi:protein TonB
MMVNVKRFHNSVPAMLGPIAALIISLGSLALAQGTPDPPKKVPQAEALAAVVTKVAPDYPVIARQLKIQGIVELEAIVTETGVVEKVNIISGNPVLTKPAAEALKKWKFNPFQTDGKPVRAVAQVGLSFKL